MGEISGLTAESRGRLAFVVGADKMTLMMFVFDFRGMDHRTMAEHEPAKVTIRPAETGDVPRIANCIEPFVAEGKLLRRTTQELEHLLPHCFVAETEGRIVGCVALEIYSPKLAELRSLAVEPAYRGQGVGKLLVQACIARAREHHVLEVMAITSSEEFFRACGFDFTLPGEKKALFLQTREE